MGLEVEAQVQQRLVKDALGPQKERDQKSPHSSVAVEEGVDGLELHVCQGRLDENRNAVGRLVEEALEVAHAIGDVLGGRRDVGGDTRARSTDPVLGGPELPRLPVGTAAAGEQLSMDLPNQAFGYR